MKLNKQNKTIYGSLDGEYKKFGRKIKSTVFSHCKGEEAVNDTLYDVFVMLADARTDGRPLSDVIPDQDRTIRDTVACLPIKKIPHTGLIFGILSALLAAAGIAVLLWYFIAPVPVGDIKYIRYSSEDGGRIYWSDLPNATIYEVDIDFGDETAKTENCELFLTLDEGRHRVKVTAYGEGKYSEPVTYYDNIIVEYPAIAGGICDFIGSSYRMSEDDNYAPFLEIDSRDYFEANSQNYVISFTPEITFYGKYLTHDGWKVHSLTAGGLVTVCDNDEGEIQFIKGNTYSFTLSGEYDIRLIMNIGLLKAYGLPEKDGEYACPGGETLFSLDGTEEDTVYADSRSNENLRFAAYDKFDLADKFEFGFSKELFCNVNTAFGERHRLDEQSGVSSRPVYLVVQNDSASSQYLHLEEQQAITADSRGVFEVKDGYTVIELNNADFENGCDFVMYGEHVYGSDDFVKANAIVPVTYTDGSTGVRTNELLTGGKDELFAKTDYIAGTKIIILSQNDRKFAYSAINIIPSREENYVGVYDFFDDGGSDTLQLVLKPGITEIGGAMWYSSVDQKVSFIDCMFVQTVDKGDEFEFLGEGSSSSTAAFIIDGYLINFGDSDVVLEAKNMSFSPQNV